MSIGTFNENHHAPCNCWISRNTSLFKSRARFMRSFVALNNFPHKQSLGARSITFVLDVVRGSYSDIPRALRSDFTGDELQFTALQSLPSTEFSSQVANFKNSFSGFHCTWVYLFSLPTEDIVLCKQINTIRLTDLLDSYSFLKNSSVYIGSCKK